MKNSIRYLLCVAGMALTACSRPDPDPVGQANNESNVDSPVAEEAETDEVLARSAVETFGQLRVSGPKLVAANGTPIQLRGMSLSWSNWWPQFYSDAVIRWLKDDFQITVVRASMGIEDPGGYLENKEREKAKIITVIDAAIADGLYVIVDWHSHHAQDHLDEAVAFFGEIAEAYGDQPNILYETYNEPLDTDSWDDTLKPYHEAVTAEIRKHDQDNLIIAGTRSWSQRVDEVISNRLSDANTMYSLHYYAASHKQELRDIAQTAIDADIPIFVTEFGVTEYTGDGFVDVEEANRWWNFLQNNTISWCNWSITDKEESSAAVKPGASGNGGWPLNMLTPSGRLVREKIRSQNPQYGR